MGAGILWRIKGWLKVLKKDAVLLYFAWKHPRTPGYIKMLLMLFAVYVLSPLDLLPDFLPVAGIVDDVTVVFFGLPLLTRLLPPAVHADCGKASEQWRAGAARLLGVLLALALGWILLLAFGLHYLFTK